MAAEMAWAGHGDGGAEVRDAVDEQFGHGRDVVEGFIECGEAERGDVIGDVREDAEADVRGSDALVLAVDAAEHRVGDSSDRAEDGHTVVVEVRCVRKGVGIPTM